MISYEKFKEVVVEKFLYYMPEKYQNKKVEIQSVNKVNCAILHANCLSQDKLCTYL